MSLMEANCATEQIDAELFVLADQNQIYYSDTEERLVVAVHTFLKGLQVLQDSRNSAELNSEEHLRNLVVLVDIVKIQLEEVFEAVGRTKALLVADHIQACQNLTA